jgi:hypothetical protein
MSLRNLLGSAMGGAALVVLAVAPMALAKDTGSFTVSCLTTDSALQTAEGGITGAPAQVTVSPANLWPPNHKMRDLTISMGLTNNLTNQSSPVAVTLTVNDVTDDQVATDDAGGGGCGAVTATQGADWSPTDFSNNAVQAGGNLAATTDAVSIGSVQARGERCAKLGTRTYSISVTCCDTTNGVCDSSPEVLDVTVPKSRKHHGKL